MTKPLALVMEERKTSVRELVAATGLPKDVVKAIAGGHYTASPSQRQRLADALGVSLDEIAWDHSGTVQHMRGNGPQWGRST